MMKDSSNIEKFVNLSKPLFFLLILGFFSWYVYFHTHFVGLEAPDAKEYAALARNVLEGKGLVASIELPYRLMFDANVPFQELRIAPLHPLVISSLFSIFGISDFTAMLSSSLFFFLTIPLIYFLAREMFSKSIAVIATSIFILHPTILRYSISGLTEPLFTFLLTLGFYILIKYDSIKSFFLLGIILGLAALTREVAIYYLPGFLAYIFFYKDRRAKNSIVLLIAFACLMAAYWIRNYNIFGNPFFDIKYMLLAAFSPIFPGYTLEKSLVGTSPWQYLLAYPSAFFHKFLVGLDYYYHTPYIREFNIYILGFFMVSLLRQHPTKKIEGLKLLLILLIAIQIFISSLTVKFYRYLVPFFPLIFIFATEFILFLFSNNWIKSRIYRYVAIFILSVTFIYPFTYSIYDGLIRPGESLRSKYSYIIDIAQNYTKEDSLILSDVPHIVGWYGKRTSIWLPYTLEMMHKIDREILSIDAILLTNHGMKDSNESEQWEEIFLKSGQIPGFTLVKEWQKGENKALLYLNNRTM